MANGAALQDLRVLDLTDDTGRFATKLLLEAGADVVQIGRGSPGAAMAGAAAERGGLLDWWYDGGKQRLEIDLDTTAGQSQLRDLAAHTDLFIETEPPGKLAQRGLDFPDLHALNPRLVQVSLTPFGRQGPRANWQTSDLVSSALGGMLSVNGTPDAPLNTWGRQSFNIGGFYAALCALAGVYAARQTGQGQHIDLSMHQSVISCTEHVLMFWFFQNLLPIPFGGRQGSVHWSGAFEVAACASGHAMITPAINTMALLDWMEADGMVGDLREIDFSDLIKFLPKVPHIMQLLRAWAATKNAHELFLTAQERHLPFGEVQTIAEASLSPQLQARGFFRNVDGNGSHVQVPGPLFRPFKTPAPAPQPPVAADSVSTILQRWTRQDSGPSQSRAAKAAKAAPADQKPLAGVRVLDFSWVLAGPYATRILADLGADVIKVQTEQRSQGANSNGNPYFVMWNRGKRSINLDMKHPQALDVFRRLVERADVVIENFSAGVLDRWGIGYEAANTWNDQIIYLSMAGAGQDGPWRDFVTFAPTIHALCGLTYLTNPPGRKDIGTGLALTDHLSGLAGALAVLEALEARQRIGTGQRIDLSQLEVGAYAMGPAFMDFLSNGREAQPQGNQDAFVDLVPNDVYACLNNEWLAITVHNDEEWRRLCTAIGAPQLATSGRLTTVAGRRQHRTVIDEELRIWAAGQTAQYAMQQLQTAGVPAGKVQTAQDLAESDEQLAARQWLSEVEHPLFNSHQIDRFPALFSYTPLEPYRPAPFFGEHNFEVYAELLGMSETEVAAAIGDGLFA